MAAITFDVAAFRAAFPAFADSTQYPDLLLQNNFDAATNFASVYPCGVFQTVAGQTANLNYLTAHITAVGDLIAAGSGPVIVKDSKVGEVSVSLDPPKSNDAFQWWLNTTPYGLALRALLSAVTVGGITTGGSPERAAFRKVGGRYWW